MSAFVIKAKTLSNWIGSHTYPVLEDGNLSFPRGEYFVDPTPGADGASLSLEHSISGAPLISRLLEEKVALYVCILSSPVSSYRRTYTSSEATHRVAWNREDLGEAPLFTPMILCRELRDIGLQSDRDGVHELWNGVTVKLERGFRLAIGPVIQLRSSILELLTLLPDSKLNNGCFEVGALTEGAFTFQVRLNPKLHRFLQYPGEDQALRANIMTHVVSACFSLLRRDFADDDGEEGWQSHRALQALAQHLEQKGIPCWDEEGFHPEHAATALYPHRIPKHGSEDAV